MSDNKRHLCLTYIHEQYDSWPKSYDTSCVKYSHCGYDWEQNSIGLWNLISEDKQDIITKEDFDEFVNLQSNVTMEPRKVWVTFNCDGSIHQCVHQKPEDKRGNEWTEFTQSPSAISQAVNLLDLPMIPDNQKDIIYELKLLAGNPSWERLAEQLNFLPRTLKNYRMPAVSTNFRRINWRIMMEVITFRCQCLLTEDKSVSQDDIKTQAILLTNHIQFKQLKYKQGIEKANDFKQKNQMPKGDSYLGSSDPEARTKKQIDNEIKAAKAIDDKRENDILAYKAQFATNAKAKTDK